MACWSCDLKLCANGKAVEVLGHLSAVWESLFLARSVDFEHEVEVPETVGHGTVLAFNLVALFLIGAAVPFTL